MKPPTRRDWFRTLGGMWPTQVDSPSHAASTLPLAIGRLYDFPPGTEQTVNHGRQLLRSTANGLQAIDLSPPAESDRKARALSLERDGFLWLHPAIEWPKTQLLSPVTGMPQRLEEDIP